MLPNGEKGHDVFPAYDPGAQQYTRAETYQKTRLPVQLASTLIPDAYRSPTGLDIPGVSLVVPSCSSLIARRVGPADSAER